MPSPHDFTLEFFEDPETGDNPVRRWILEELSPVLGRLLGAAMRAILQKDGAQVCGTEFGKQLGRGLFEFRVNRDPQAIIDVERQRKGKTPKRVDPPAEKILLRVFCHAYGERVILLLGAYDKARDTSPKKQNEEIATARTRLRRWQQQERMLARAGRARGRAKPH